MGSSMGEAVNHRVDPFADFGWLAALEDNDSTSAHMTRRQGSWINDGLSYLGGNIPSPMRFSSALAGTGKTIFSEIIEAVTQEIAENAAQNGLNLDLGIAMAKRAGTDLAMGAREAPLAILGGARDAGQEVLDITHDLAKWLNDNVVNAGQFYIDKNGIRWKSGVEDSQITFPEVPEQQTTTGKGIRDVSQFATGLLPGLKVAKTLKVATGAAKTARTVSKGTAKIMPGIGADIANNAGHTGKVAELAVASAVSEAVAFDPYGGSLAKTFEDMVWSNATTRYLVTDPNDSQAEARFKRAMEGVLFGATLGVPGLAYGIAKAGVRKIRGKGPGTGGGSGGGKAGGSGGGKPTKKPTPTRNGGKGDSQ